jgi:hypothetical protein
MASSQFLNVQCNGLSHVVQWVPVFLAVSDYCPLTSRLPFFHSRLIPTGLLFPPRFFPFLTINSGHPTQEAASCKEACSFSADQETPYRSCNPKDHGRVRKNSVLSSYA